MAPPKRSMEKQLTSVRVALMVEEQRHVAECNIFVDSYAPPRWRGRIWAITPAAVLKRGSHATIVLPKGDTVEISIGKAGVRGAYDFDGEGLPPAF